MQGKPSVAGGRRPRGQTAVAKRGARAGGLLGAYPAPFRRAVCTFAGRAPCFAELAETFPGLLFALSTRYGTAEARRTAANRIAAGARLREAADALGLPWWTRKLPPHAFAQRLRRLPDEAEFARRIVNLLPSTRQHSAKWLDQVLLAHRSCHAEFALWVARHARASPRLFSDSVLPYLAAWAWHADHRETPAGRLLRDPWTPAMSPRRAFEELTAWRKRIRLSLALGGLQRERWLADGTALGYEFTELREVEDFIAESAAMNNCLDAFSEKIEAGVCYVFSIREGALPVADVEIGPHQLEPQFPAIVQLRGPRNGRASAQVWRAAYAWLADQALRPTPPFIADVPGRREAWRTLWKPYLAERAPADRARFERLATSLDRVVSGRASTRRRPTADRRSAPPAPIEA